eukprot:TRINITY_DN2950_c1_g1_i1.p1 TRINITY_DN2950_c1_g1~~TRINITY_DN2950_c1_g1_i1.p1  ORF type:complete len:484 (+),score=195.66 TRINITY_DN2950_c1_g1_i1:84-1535(+)
MPEEVMSARAQEVEAELKRLIQEQTDSLGELIAATVDMHDTCKREVAAAFAQDKEEDAIVRELVLRSEMAERDLQRNPQYAAYREGDAARLREERKATGFYHWVKDEDLSQHGEWLDMVELTAADCDQFLRSVRKPVPGDDDEPLPVELPDAVLKLAARIGFHDASLPVYVKIKGCPVRDLQYHAASCGRDLLGAATSLVRAWRAGPTGRLPVSKGPATDLELNTLAHTLKSLQARAEAPAIDALRGSKCFKTDHVTPAQIQDIPLHVAIVPLEGALHKMHVRAVVTKGSLRALENAAPGTHYPSLDLPDVREAVEKFMETVCLPKTDLLGANFVADLVVDPPHGDGPIAVKLSWVHKLSTDMLVLMSWEELCALSQAPQAPVWFTGTPQPALLEKGCDAVFDLLVAERSHLAPGEHTCWETKDTAATDHMASLGAPPPHPHADPQPAAMEESASGRWSQVPVGTIGIAAAAFVAGVFLARKK